MMLVSTNPSRGYAELGRVEASSAQDVAQAVSRARAAQPHWAASSLGQRCEAMSAFADVCEGRSEEISQLVAAETGRPITIARGNTAGGISDLRAYLPLAEEALADTVTHETSTEVHTARREPWGVLAAIGTWNFPFMNVTLQCGPALLAGNTLVYKASEESPLFTALLADLVAESGLPDGVLNVVYGDGAVGSSLAHADVDMISFTGGVKTGRRLAVVAAERFVPFVAELGGSSPCIVFDDVEVTDELAEFLFVSRFFHSGQDCAAVKRLIVHESVFQPLVEKLVALAGTKKLGDACDETTDLGPLISERQVVAIEDQVRDALDKGATVLAGGRRPPDLDGAYYEPTILVGVNRGMQVWTEETFGPVLPVVPFASEAEAIQLANDTVYGLGAHVVTQDKGRFHRLAGALQAGMVAHNNVSYFHPRNPFGGYKQSGLGRENGIQGFHDVTQIKLVSELK